MRYLIFILVFLLSTCSDRPYPPSLGGTYDYEGNSPQKILNIAEAVRLEYMPGATIYIIYDQPLSYGILGLANKVGPHTYLIQLHSSNPDPESTIFHELGHVLDSEYGRLKFSTPMQWDGHRCDFTIPWHERPWEISANEWRDCLIYDFNNRALKYYDYSLDDYLKAYNLEFIWLK